MAAILRFYLSDGVTPAPDLPVSIVAGASSATVEYWLKNDGDAVATGTRARVSADAGAGFVMSGEPILDERWSRIREIGYDDSGAAATMAAHNTAFQAIGAEAAIALPDIPAGGIRKLELYVRMPQAAASATVTLKLQAASDQNTIALGREVAAALGTGVYRGSMDAALRRIARGLYLTAVGTDTVTLSGGTTDYDGIRTTIVGESQAFNQNDSAAAALAVGEQYQVRVSANAAAVVTWTKGVKASGVATVPALPAGSLDLGSFAVDYGAGGSVIDQSDIDQTAVLRGEHLVEAGTGLNVIINPGEGLSETDAYQWSDAAIQVALAASDTSYVWKLPDSTAEATLVEVPPEIGAALLAEADTDAGAVTAIRDRRTILSPAIVEHVEVIRYAGALSVEPVPVYQIGKILIPFDCEIDAVTLLQNVSQAHDTAADSAATWTAGSTKIDVRLVQPGAEMPRADTDAGTAGATLWTSNGTTDLRPSLAYDAAVLFTKNQSHEVMRVKALSWLLVDLVAVPTAPAAEQDAELTVAVHLRRY